MTLKLLATLLELRLPTNPDELVSYWPSWLFEGNGKFVAFFTGFIIRLLGNLSYPPALGSGYGEQIKLKKEKE